MSSMQAPGGASKAAKFKDALRSNPLGPIADPFSGLNDDQSNNHQKKLSEAVYMQLLNNKDKKVGPLSSYAHQQVQQEAIASNKVEDARRSKIENSQNSDLQSRAKSITVDELREIDSDDELLDELESDPAFEALRERRIQQMKLQNLKEMENRAKGHGEYRTISQDEFLPETTDSSSEWTVVHFYHNQFEKCKIMDHHLKQIAEKHLECKFLRIDAEKTPFFCSKLKIRTLPTVLVFQEGQTMGRLVGFEGISDGNEWPTKLLQKWLSGTGAIHYKIPIGDELENGMNLLSMAGRSIWRGGFMEYDEDEESR